MSLLHKDYIDILNFYNIDGVNMTKKDVKLLAEDYLANKLCRCIKKVNPKKKNEKKAIKICRNSVLHKKGLDVKKFKCKKKLLLFLIKELEVNFLSIIKNLKKVLEGDK